MSDEREIRCPHCNGTGRLPEMRARQIEAERDMQVIRLHKLGVLWGELCDAVTSAGKKSATLDTVRTRLRRAHVVGGANLTLSERVGYGTDEHVR